MVTGILGGGVDLRYTVYTSIPLCCERVAVAKSDPGLGYWVGSLLHMHDFLTLEVKIDP